MENIELIDVNGENIHQYGICGYKSMKRPGYPEKIAWLNQRFQEGLKIKMIVSPKDGAQGMIEYIPGQFCWRPVNAANYMFIHCLFVVFKKEYKGKGYASQLLNTCINDAKTQKMAGVAIVTRKSSFMVGKELFLKHHFQVVDHAEPDFDLLALPFASQTPPPQFRNQGQNLDKYGKGLTILRADQCPYTVKNVNEILDTTKKQFNLTPQLIQLKDYRQAQDSPCAFGSFCIIYNGKIVAHHPISNTRFINIMKQINK